MSNHEGMLVVWADIPEEFEDDFNRWYDLEHVEERIRLPGFIVGARYLANGKGRRYLGLYRTQTLGAFETPAYREAFANQTPWSVTNLNRMVDPMRRVCRVTCQTGIGGRGTSVALLRLNRMPTPMEQEAFEKAGALVQAIDGVVSTSLLVPDVAKSGPLPAEKTDNRVMDPILLIEGSSVEATKTAATAAARSINPDGVETSLLDLTWLLYHTELSPK